MENRRTDMTSSLRFHYIRLVQRKEIFQKVEFEDLRWRRDLPPKRRLIFNGLHGVMSQKIELFNIPVLHIGTCYSLSCAESGEEFNES
jgi:hypothetical protein